MRKLIIIFCLLPSILVNAQVIDWNHFNEQMMDDAIFNKMSDYSKKEASYPINRDSIVSQKIYKCVEKDNEKLSLDGIGAKIDNILKKYDSPAIKRTNKIGNVALIDSIPCENPKTYQEIADKCFTDWITSDYIVFIRWSQMGDAITYFNKKTQTIYIVFAFLN